MKTEHYPLGDTLNLTERKQFGLSIDEAIRLLMIQNPRKDGVYVRAVKTGEFRSPKRGEWYLSGAEPFAFRASTDYVTKFHIVKLQTIKRTSTITWSES